MPYLFASSVLRQTVFALSSGDNGIDLQVKNGDGTYDVYQVKKFAHTLKTSQKSQIKKSLKSLNDYIRETRL